nr:hypothetical protein CFP56_04272 [Quercus suber]
MEKYSRNIHTAYRAEIRSSSTREKQKPVRPRRSGDWSQNPFEVFHRSDVVEHRFDRPDAGPQHHEQECMPTLCRDARQQRMARMGRRSIEDEGDEMQSQGVASTLDSWPRPVLVDHYRHKQAEPRAMTVGQSRSSQHWWDQDGRGASELKLTNWQNRPSQRSASTYLEPGVWFSPGFGRGSKTPARPSTRERHGPYIQRHQDVDTAISRPRLPESHSSLARNGRKITNIPIFPSVKPESRMQRGLHRLRSISASPFSSTDDVREISSMKLDDGVPLESIGDRRADRGSMLSFARNVSRMLTPTRHVQRRDSNMSFVDHAPPEMMLPCRNCGRIPNSVLLQSLCQDCREPSRKRR